MSHALWQRVRRPFRVPACSECQWECYDVDRAGCLRCGREHWCVGNNVDNKCQLIEAEECHRVCQVTGFVLPEVRRSHGEYSDNVSFAYESPPCTHIEEEVECVVWNFLKSEKARRCMHRENAKQCTKIRHHMYKQLKQFKLLQPNCRPVIQVIWAASLAQESSWSFMQPPSTLLVKQSAKQIVECLSTLKSKGMRITSGVRLQTLVCGLLFLLRSGLKYKNSVLLAAIPEIQLCLPHENKLEMYFGISSKIICCVENEIKLVFREVMQDA
jgi:hypothetical protein